MNIFATGETQLERDGESYTVAYSVTGKCARIPERLHGPPEYCHPDESYCDITEVIGIWAADPEGEDVKSTTLLDELAKLIPQEELEEALWKAFNASGDE